MVEEEDSGTMAEERSKKRNWHKVVLAKLLVCGQKQN